MKEITEQDVWGRAVELWRSGMPWQKAYEEALFEMVELEPESKQAWRTYFDEIDAVFNKTPER